MFVELEITCRQKKPQGFEFRWKNVWDEGFPEKWMAFVSSNLSNIESNLLNSIAKLETDSGKKPVALPYQIFASDIYQNYCRNWCNSPGDDVFAEMHDIFFNKCKHVVLKEHGYSSLIPSWVLNIVTEEFFCLLNRYIVDLTSNPLSLVKLCRKVLSTNDPSVLINLFRSIEKQDLRECLFHICCSD